ncbi:MAG: NADH-quinone oxidoreductase subunit NuoN [Propionibacteriales bacterium]|nr:NADH-quinone oxidoreductase subunit NuoN [Propionibacteriales bacterium]
MIAVHGSVLAQEIEIESPNIAYSAIYPILIVFGVALVGVLVEAFAPRPRRYVVQTVLAAAGLGLAFVGTVLVAGDLPETQNGLARGGIEAEGALAVDGPTLFIWGAILLLSFFSVLLFAERRLESGVTAFAGQAAALPGTEAEREASTRGLEHTEVFPLMLFAVGGMMLFPASNDLLTMFVALEVLSFPLYLLCGLARRRRLLSQEAAVKYFLLGAFASGFFLYGIALVYGYAGTVTLAGIDGAITNRVGGDGLLLAGIGLMAVGLLFKIGAAPFHAWTPDVYQGAPTAVTGFMAACTKVAAFGALLRVFYVAFGGAQWNWMPMMWIVAALTMGVGCVLTLTQTDVKRMLAYSSIAHAGFLLTGFVGVQAATRDSDDMTSLVAVMFYLLAYGFTTLGAFAVVTVVRDSSGEATHLSRWAGLGKQSPVLAGVFALFMLAFLGLPATSGFMAKWAVFTSAWAGDAQLLVIIAVLASVITAFVYIRVIVLMFFADPVGEGPTVAMPSVLTVVTIAAGVVVTVALGVAPQPVLDLAHQAGEFVR